MLIIGARGIYICIYSSGRLIEIPFERVDSLIMMNSRKRTLKIIYLRINIFKILIKFIGKSVLIIEETMINAIVDEK